MTIKSAQSVFCIVCRHIGARMYAAADSPEGLLAAAFFHTIEDFISYRMKKHVDAYSRAVKLSLTRPRPARNARFCVHHFARCGRKNELYVGKESMCYEKKNGKLSFRSQKP